MLKDINIACFVGLAAVIDHGNDAKAEREGEDRKGAGGH